MKHLKSLLGLVAALSVVTPSLATDLTVATFNLAWAGTWSDFQKHVEVCSAPKVNWCNSQDKNVELASACQALFDEAAGGAVSGLKIAPCNAYGLKREKVEGASGNIKMFFEEKEAILRNAVDKLIKEQKVDVIAFQEVSSVEAIKGILGRNVAEFGACAAPHTSFQTVGFAWRKSLNGKEDPCRSEDKLAILEKYDDVPSGKRLRPGLAMSITVGEKELSILNVHLKSRCANLMDSSRFGPGAVLSADKQHCKVLNRQVVPLETWIEDEAKKTPYVVVLGDFNRRIDEEISAAPKDIRADKSNPKNPHVPTGKPDGTVTTSYLWQEISDGDPTLVWMGAPSVQKGCYEGLDHIVLTQALNLLLKAKAKPAKISVPTKTASGIDAADHCPQMIKLQI